MANLRRIQVSGGAGGYTTIQNNGSNLPQETILNFVGGNVTIVDNPGVSTDVTITSGTSFPWTVVTSNTTMAVNNGYFANNAAGLTLTLPVVAGVGATFEISNMSTGTVTIAQNAGQTIRFGNLITTTGTSGNVTLINIGDGVSIVCNVANNGFQVVPGAIGSNIGIT